MDIDNISDGVCHIVYRGDVPHAAFALFKGVEPTYEYIENSEWLNDDEYLTIHRIASDGVFHGIFAFVINYCKGISRNIRIDTHNDNAVMQKQIKKNRFVRCGRIYVADGSARITYQWSEDND